LNSIENTLFIGKVFKHFDNLPSTNAYATEWLEKTGTNPENRLVTEGVVFTTFNQMAGRGQMGNRWESEPDKNLAFTVILNPHFLQARTQFQLNKAISLAVFDFIKMKIAENRFSTEGVVKIKWANDIYINEKKICGILIQNTLSNHLVNTSIVGIGININQTDFQALPQATSLKNETHNTYDLYNCIENLAQCIENRYIQLKSKQFDKLNNEYLTNLYRYEEEAIYQYKNGDYFKGKIIGTTDSGKLLIEKKDGVEAFDLKEVKFC
jgi:BirA family transcriptional regulator, biotin operon repressor / biotin---[acetyl-CoA-carboxylase] ligase